MQDDDTEKVRKVKGLLEHVRCLTGGLSRVSHGLLVV